jgi:hypothetical protein
MKFVLLIYNDPPLLDALPRPEFDARMRTCLAHADDLKRDGKLLDTQMLASPSAAKTVRVRDGRRTVVDGPFAETKEVIAGFNVIEAASLDEALEIASQFPWTSTGCVEVRPIVDVGAVRASVGAPPAAGS